MRCDSLSETIFVLRLHERRMRSGPFLSQTLRQQTKSGTFCFPGCSRKLQDAGFNPCTRKKDDRACQAEPFYRIHYRL